MLNTKTMIHNLVAKSYDELKIKQEQKLFENLMENAKDSETVLKECSDIQVNNKNLLELTKNAITVDKTPKNEILHS